jgi:hypothetical protein
MLTADNIILPPEWETEDTGYGYKCRVCHNECMPYTPAISSPNYAFYHPWCVEESPSYQRDLRKMLKDEARKKHL